MPLYYLTTPIFYVNDVPHIGHAYTAVNADALARWHRLIGDEVFFLTGTDEHGLKVARSAQEHNCTPQEWTDTTSARFSETWKRLNISNDDFIRTTEKRHHLAVKTFLERIRDRGYIYVGEYEGLYCVGCEAYYGEGELEAGSLCPIHKRPAEVLREENYFFKLSAFQEALLDFYTANPQVIRPQSKLNEALGFIRGGLEDFSISRNKKSVSWGVEIPWDRAHVVYVWTDALVNYLTALGYGQEDGRWESWWPAVHHLLGKDILRFHGVYWPAMCMAAGIDPPGHLQVHGWLLVGGEKMAKSRLNQIFPGDLADEFGVDGLRYHLLRDNPLGPDGDFTYEAMTQRYNSDLANNFGNLLSRVATVIEKGCGGVGPAPNPSSNLKGEVESHLGVVIEAWGRNSPSEGLEATWKLIQLANASLEATEPWKMQSGPQLDLVMGDALEILRIVAILASPAMPGACQVLWDAIGLEGSPGSAQIPQDLKWGGYCGGIQVTRRSPLFPRKK